MDQNLANLLEDGCNIAVVGTRGTASFRVLFMDDSWRPFSAWNEAPLHSEQGDYAAICATPRGTTERLDLCLTEPFHPLSSAADSAEEDPRDPDKLPALSFALPTPCHVSYAPQSWMDPQAADPRMGPGIPGDGRPLQILDLSEDDATPGALYTVKPLGALAVVHMGFDTPMMSWHILAVNALDPMAALLKDVEDISNLLPEKLEEVKEWLKKCDCTTRGSIPSALGFNSRPQNKEVALQVLASCHQSWQLLTASLGSSLRPDPWPPRASCPDSESLALLWARQESAWSLRARGAWAARVVTRGEGILDLPAGAGEGGAQGKAKKKGQGGKKSTASAAGSDAVAKSKGNGQSKKKMHVEKAEHSRPKSSGGPVMRSQKGSSSSSTGHTGSALFLEKLSAATAGVKEKKREKRTGEEGESADAPGGSAALGVLGLVPAGLKTKQRMSMARDVSRRRRANESLTLVSEALEDDSTVTSTSFSSSIADSTSQGNRTHASSARSDGGWEDSLSVGPSEAHSSSPGAQSSASGAERGGQVTVIFHSAPDLAQGEEGGLVQRSDSSTSFASSAKSTGNKREESIDGGIEERGGVHGESGGETNGAILKQEPGHKREEADSEEEPSQYVYTYYEDSLKGDGGLELHSNRSLERDGPGAAEWDGEQYMVPVQAHSPTQDHSQKSATGQRGEIANGFVENQIQNGRGNWTGDLTHASHRTIPLETEGLTAAEEKSAIAPEDDPSDEVHPAIVLELAGAKTEPRMEETQGETPAVPRQRGGRKTLKMEDLKLEGAQLSFSARSGRASQPPPTQLRTNSSQAPVAQGKPMRFASRRVIQQEHSPGAKEDVEEVSFGSAFFHLDGPKPQSLVKSSLDKAPSESPTSPEAHVPGIQPTKNMTSGDLDSLSSKDSPPPKPQAPSSSSHDSPAAAAPHAPKVPAPSWSRRGMSANTLSVAESAQGKQKPEDSAQVVAEFLASMQAGVPLRPRNPTTPSAGVPAGGKAGGAEGTGKGRQDWQTEDNSIPKAMAGEHAPGSNGQSAHGQETRSYSQEQMALQLGSVYGGELREQNSGPGRHAGFRASSSTDGGRSGSFRQAVPSGAPGVGSGQPMANFTAFLGSAVAGATAAAAAAAARASEAASMARQAAQSHSVSGGANPSPGGSASFNLLESLSPFIPQALMSNQVQDKGNRSTASSNTEKASALSAPPDVALVDRARQQRERFLQKMKVKNAEEAAAFVEPATAVEATQRSEPKRELVQRVSGIAGLGEGKTEDSSHWEEVQAQAMKQQGEEVLKVLSAKRGEVSSQRAIPEKVVPPSSAPGGADWGGAVPARGSVSKGEGGRVKGEEVILAALQRQREQRRSNSVEKVRPAAGVLMGGGVVQGPGSGHAPSGFPERVRNEVGGLPPMPSPQVAGRELEEEGTRGRAAQQSLPRAGSWGASPIEESTPREGGFKPGREADGREQRHASPKGTAERPEEEPQPPLDFPSSRTLPVQMGRGKERKRTVLPALPPRELVLDSALHALDDEAVEGGSRKGKGRRAHHASPVVMYSSADRMKGLEDLESSSATVVHTDWGLERREREREEETKREGPVRAAKVLAPLPTPEIRGRREVGGGEHEEDEEEDTREAAIAAAMQAALAPRVARSASGKDKDGRGKAHPLRDQLSRVVAGASMPHLPSISPALAKGKDLLAASLGKDRGREGASEAD